MSVRLIFDGPPDNPGSCIIGAETPDGHPLRVGSVRMDGTRWLMTFEPDVPRPVADPLIDTPSLSYRYGGEHG